MTLPPRNLRNAALRISFHRCPCVNCSAVALIRLRNALTLVRTSAIWAALACVLDVGGVRQYAERVRGAILGSDRLQQQTRNRTRIWATRVGAGGDHRKFVAPDYAAVEGALPRGAAKGEWVRGEPIGVGIGAEEVGEDLLA